MIVVYGFDLLVRVCLVSIVSDLGNSLLFRVYFFTDSRCSTLYFFPKSFEGPVLNCRGSTHTDSPGLWTVSTYATMKWCVRE
jgi:hypothetical protein